MWYVELIVVLLAWGILINNISLVDVTNDEQKVANECFRLVGALREVQDHSRNYHYMDNMDFRPLCYIYRDHYDLQFEQNGVIKRYDLPEDMSLDFYDTANFMVFRQKSLYNAWTNKTIKISKGNIAKYIIINRIGRIRISNWYEDSP